MKKKLMRNQKLEPKRLNYLLMDDMDNVPLYNTRFLVVAATDTGETRDDKRTDLRQRKIFIGGRW